MSRVGSLLFGTRRPRPLSDKQREARVTAEQRYEEKRQRDQFTEKAEAAREALLAGDGLPLAELLEANKSEEVRQAENDFVEEFVGELYNRLVQSRQDPEPLNCPQSMTGLVALADKCSGREMLFDEVSFVCHRYGAAMASQRLFKELKERASKIGALPAASHDYHYKAHIPVSPGGHAVCGATLKSGYTSFNYELKAFIHSAATAVIECQCCLDLYKRNNNEGVTLAPAQWIEMLDEFKYSYWGDCFDLGTGGFFKSGSKEERTAKLINHYYQRAEGRLEEMLAAVKETPSSLSH